MFFALSGYLPNCSAQGADRAAGTSQVLAVVNGKPITEADIRASASTQFTSLDREYQQNLRKLLESSLDQVVQDRLIEAEAATRRTSKEALLASIRPTPVTDADINTFYEQNKAQIPRPLEQVASQIRQYLEQQRQLTARQEFFKQLEAKYRVEKRLEPIRTEVSATGPSKGPANAPVTLILFSGFQDPFTARLNPTLQQVLAKYGIRVRLVFRQFPLDFHQHARKAAEASLCAADQGKFWEMYDAMFATQQELAVEQLKARAAQLRLNAAQFNSCLDSGKHARTVEADLKAGAEAGVTGTPAMFINGRFISGAVPLEQITQVIDDELRRKGLR